MLGLAGIAYLGQSMWRKVRHFFGKHYINSDTPFTWSSCALCHKIFTFDEVRRMAKKLKSQRMN